MWGLGTTSPATYKLDIQGTVGQNLFGVSTNTAGQNVNLNFTNSGGQTGFVGVVRGDSCCGIAGWTQLASNSCGFGVMVTTGFSNPVALAPFGGNVGVGTVGPSDRLHVVDTSNNIVLRLQGLNGTCTHAPQAGSETVSCSSDERLKKNIRNSESSLDDLLKFQIRNYEIQSTGKKTTGVIAQEVKKVFPEMVSQDEKGTLMVEQLNPWKMVKALQELAFRLRSTNELLLKASDQIHVISEKKEESDKRVLSLEKENKKLREEITTLSQRVATQWLEVDERLRAVENTNMAKK